MFFGEQSEMELIGCSPAFIEVTKQVGRVAATSLPVLLTGESGTGKEVVACALQKRSLRAKQPFIVVNCGAVPVELIESELFGHVKGAFSGADRDRTGLLEEANGGTVFLNEITETTPMFQVKLLRAIQEGEIRRVGSNETREVDVRFLAASNRDVEAEVKAGQFRQDLYYCLNTVAIALPPLRARKEDIVLLAERFAERCGLNRSVNFSTEVLTLFGRYPWPGNIRDLENAVTQAAAMCDGTIRIPDLPERIRNYQSDCFLSDQALTGQSTDAIDWLTLSQVEGQYVTRVLQHTQGNKQAAAKVLKVDRKTLDRMIKRHQITISRTARFRLQRGVLSQAEQNPFQ